MNTAIDDDLVQRVCDAARSTPGDVRTLVVREVQRLAPLADAESQRRLTERALSRLEGLDIIDDYLSDPLVDEIMINAGSEVWIDRAGTMIHVASLAPGAVDVVLERILAPLGRRLDRTQPIVDARLANGARVCAVVAPIAVDGTIVAVRRHRRRRFGIDDFVDGQVSVLVRELIAGHANILIVGATSSGKTTLLAALIELIDPNDRIVVIEDTAELPIEIVNGARLEARPSTTETVRSVSIDDLVITAMRLRPDRLILGEFRGIEVRTVVGALNTGHDGSLSTCHANSAEDGLRRVETLLLQAAPGWPLPAIRREVTRSFDIVIFVERHSNGRRRIDTVGEVIESDGEPTVRILARDGVVFDRYRRRRRAA